MKSIDAAKPIIIFHFKLDKTQLYPPGIQYNHDVLAKKTWPILNWQMGTLYGWRFMDIFYQAPMIEFNYIVLNNRCCCNSYYFGIPFNRL